MQPFKAVYFNFQLQFRIHGLFCSFRNTSSNLIQSIYKKFYSPLLLLRQQIPSVQMTLLLCIQVNQIILPIKEFSQGDSVSLHIHSQWLSMMDKFPRMHIFVNVEGERFASFARRYTVHPRFSFSFLIRPTISRFILSASSLSFLFTHHITIYDKWTIFRQTTFNLFFNEYGIIDAVSIRGRKRPSIIIFSKKEASYAYFSLNNYSQ